MRIELKCLLFYLVMLSYSLFVWNRVGLANDRNHGASEDPPLSVYTRNRIEQKISLGLNVGAVMRNLEVRTEPRPKSI